MLYARRSDSTGLGRWVAFAFPTSRGVGITRHAVTLCSCIHHPLRVKFEVRSYTPQVFRVGSAFVFHPHFSRERRSLRWALFSFNKVPTRKPPLLAAIRGTLGSATEFTGIDGQAHRRTRNGPHLFRAHGKHHTAKSGKAADARITSSDDPETSILCGRCKWVAEPEKYGHYTELFKSDLTRDQIREQAGHSSIRRKPNTTRGRPHEGHSFRRSARRQTVRHPTRAHRI